MHNYIFVVVVVVVVFLLLLSCFIVFKNFVVLHICDTDHVEIGEYSWLLKV